MRSFACLAAALLCTVAQASGGIYVDEQESNRLSADAVSGDATLATGSIRYFTSAEINAAGYADRNIVMDVKLAEGREWKRLDIAEFWSCNDLSFLWAAQYAGWDEAAEGAPASGDYLCHLSRFVHTKYNTEIQYYHYRGAYPVTIEAGDVPSVKLEEW